MKVGVEVSAETFLTKNKSTMQKCFIDLGGKYPEACSRFIAEGEKPLAAGNYYATSGRIENFRPVIDLRDLTPIPKA